MTDVLEKIRKLVALAGSDNRNEAANAALTACRLIREHDVQIGAKTSASPKPFDFGGYDGSPFSGTYPNRPDPFAGVGFRDFSDVFEMMKRAREEAMRDRAARARRADREARERSSDPESVEVDCPRCGAAGRQLFSNDNAWECRRCLYRFTPPEGAFRYRCPCGGEWGTCERYAPMEPSYYERDPERINISRERYEGCKRCYRPRDKNEGRPCQRFPCEGRLSRRGDYYLCLGCGVKYRF